MAHTLHIELAMRISAFSSALALTVFALAGSARADHATDEYRYHARTHAVAAAEPTHAYSTVQAAAITGAPTPALGELAITGAAPVHAAAREPWLSTHDITATVAPHAADIEHCYVGQLAASAPGGTLELTLVIGRDGSVVSLTAAAPGWSRAATHKLETCVRAAVGDAAFPARRNDTTAVVPYLFHRTPATPIPSCWSAKGCAQSSN